MRSPKPTDPTALKTAYGVYDLVLFRVEAFHAIPGVSPLVFHASDFHSLATHAA
jgi:hypothetical protein